MRPASLPVRPLLSPQCPKALVRRSTIVPEVKVDLLKDKHRVSDTTQAIELNVTMTKAWRETGSSRRSLEGIYFALT
jgi:hypothetical protein